jgi:sugar/nucleoside kinase (ribokinase family)
MLSRDHLLFADRLPDHDEVAVASSFSHSLGGRGLLTAFCLAHMGLTARLCTVVGASVRAEVTGFLADAGIDSDLVDFSTAPTGTPLTEFYAFVEANGMRHSAVAVPAEVDWAPSAGLLDAVSGQQPDFVYLTTNEAGFSTAVLSAVDLSQSVVVTNLGYQLTSSPELTTLVLEHTAVFIGNRQEQRRFEQHTGRSVTELFRCCPRLRAVVTTAGTEPVAVATPRSLDFFELGPLLVSEPRSPVGAGDAFAAGFISSLSSDIDLGVATRSGMRLGRAAVLSLHSYPDLSSHER